MHAILVDPLPRLIWCKVPDPVIYKTLAMRTHAEEAHSILQDQENTGKVLLPMD